MIGAKHYAEPKYCDVLGRRMAYIDEGTGDAIAFQHTQPTCSYVWRNVTPHLEGLGRLIACDLIGMAADLGGSTPVKARYAACCDGTSQPLAGARSRIVHCGETLDLQSTDCLSGTSRYIGGEGEAPAKRDET